MSERHDGGQQGVTGVAQVQNAVGGRGDRPNAAPFCDHPRIPRGFVSMRLLVSVLLAAALGCTSPQGFGTADRATETTTNGRASQLDPDERAGELIRVSGVESHVLALGHALRAAAEQQSDWLSVEQAAQLRDAAAAATQTPPLITAARTHFHGRDHDAAAERALAFSTSPLGLHLRSVEAAAEVDIDEADLQAFIDALFAKPVPLDRIDLLMRLAEATRGAELSAEVDAVAQRVAARSAILLSHGNRAANAPDADALAVELAAIDAHSKARAAMWRAQASVLMQYVYRDVSDDELSAYAGFAESDAGRWLVDATARTLADLEPWLDARMTDALRHPVTQTPPDSDMPASALGPER